MDRFQFCASLVCGAALAALPRAAFAQATPAQRLDTPRAIDMAGRLRMLSQRCTKAYLQWGQSIAGDSARTLLQESVSRYEAHLAALKTFMPNPAVQASLPQLQTLWSQFKALLIGEPSRTGAAALYDANETLQSAAHYLTVSYGNTNGSPLEYLIGLAGRQRMLSQRLAKNYGLVAAGLDSRPLRDQIAGDAEEFQRAMAQLAGAPLSTPAIRTTLELGQGQWVFFDMAIKRQPNARGLEDVATTSERLLEVMDSLTALYEVALQDVLG